MVKSLDALSALAFLRPSPARPDTRHPKGMQTACQVLLALYKSVTYNSLNGEWIIRVSNNQWLSLLSVKIIDT